MPAPHRPPGRRRLRTRTLAAIAALLLSAGCLGFPPDAAGMGDQVTVVVDVEDLQTGALLLQNRTLTFRIGSGDSGLGHAFEHALRGARPGDEIHHHGSAPLGYGKPVTVQRDLPPLEITHTWPRNQFESSLGEAIVGASYPAGVFTVHVETVTNTSVTFHVDVADGTRDPAPDVGVYVLLRVRPDLGVILHSLEPDVGATFTIDPSPAGTPLGLPPGAYITQGATATHILYGFASQHTPLVGRTLHIDGVVVAVQKAPATLLEGPNYGVRDSPVVDGRLHDVPLFGPLGAAVVPPPDTPRPADDGHDPPH